MRIINKYRFYSTSVGTKVSDLKKLILYTFQTLFSFYYLIGIIMLSAAYLEYNLFCPKYKKSKWIMPAIKVVAEYLLWEQTFIFGLNMKFLLISAWLLLYGMGAPELLYVVSDSLKTKQFFTLWMF